ncbi:hypothetical protein M406DRAFT_67950 [Cryphonectria parasitica EP155]|uniref:Ima1 N-terminal domain-containing protein n=1 Tax=Cryphonectria parasitica (strain ATCC 38755 / EP155) TaxID=660469 RepID=A0A9P5CNV7_CRYP1|nr:uncharacterized protein M406DRAFT_67950 [Cryphonectria parasitica EP155]KAF3765513.1 hypothetical protein M406DRAFT_67950 [Cryphonectria parasitica EP155]
MAPRRKINKLLTCFYCGRRSTTRYDGHMQHFDCEKCNATNYLDSNGDITDPPVATTATPDAPNYIQRGLTPPPPTNQVFCQKCLNNQHLFISSLAQYFPDDPDDPEYVERERNYYKFRRGLEKRYPQVCVTCEPKVHEQLDKAAYTAKTDYLRRMLDRSAQTRVLLTTTPGHYWHFAGRWIWATSLVLQLLWHVQLIQRAVLGHSSEFDHKSWAMLVARTGHLFTGRLPSPDRIVYWSFWASVLSFWWNPRWVETYNGFTKHLVGRRTFYLYQALILALKVPGWRGVSVLPAASADRVIVQVVAHTFMAAFMYFLYTTAHKSIHTDHTPLWLPKRRTLGVTSSPAAPATQPPEPRGSGEQSMADILDEILSDPTPMPAVDPSPYVSRFTTTDHFDHMPSSNQRSSYDPSVGLLGSNPFRDPSPSRQSVTTSYGLDDLSITDSPRPRTRAQTRAQARSSQLNQYDMEMDWAPTQSQYRAFNTFQPGQSRNLKFNETPVQEKPGAFWAKVPPAPTTPAQRIFNPPNAPIIRNTAAPTASTVRFQGSTTGLRFGHPQAPSDPGTPFANPSFFPKPPSDERDNLSGLLQNSLTLGPTRDETSQRQSNSTQGQTLMSKMMYLVLGLCLAVLGNRAYIYFSQMPLADSSI